MLATWVICSITCRFTSMSSTHDTVWFLWQSCSHTSLSEMKRMPQRANCLQSKQWQQERSCVKRCLHEWMAQASQRSVREEDGSCAWNVVCCAQSNLHHAVCSRHFTVVHPISAHPSRRTPVRGPGASRVCCTLLWYNGVCHRNQEHTMDPHRALAAHTDAAFGILATWMLRAHTSHLTATHSLQHSPDGLIRHAVIMGNLSQWFSLFNTLEHGSPLRRRDLPARIR